VSKRVLLFKNNKGTPERNKRTIESLEGLGNERHEGTNHKTSNSRKRHRRSSVSQSLRHGDDRRYCLERNRLRFGNGDGNNMPGKW
jgi:hypothetical protein